MQIKLSNWRVLAQILCSPPLLLLLRVLLRACVFPFRCDHRCRNVYVGSESSQRRSCEFAWSLSGERLLITALAPKTSSFNRVVTQRSDDDYCESIMHVANSYRKLAFVVEKVLYYMMSNNHSQATTMSASFSLSQISAVDLRTTSEHGIGMLTILWVTEEIWRCACRR